MISFRGDGRDGDKVNVDSKDEHDTLMSTLNDAYFNSLCESKFVIIITNEIVKVVTPSRGCMCGSN